MTIYTYKTTGKYIIILHPIYIAIMIATLINFIHYF